ncbi:MAG: hypothetical protein HYU81_01615 [Candidatus Brennerbacteria bacterium]|nr:hypothetical protein [Candidatus Brennerbacteria bacterium]
MPLSIFMNARAFLRKLQRAPEPVRKRWFIGFSAAAIAVVLAGWALSLNFSVAPEELAEATESKEPPFAQTFGRGIAVIQSETSERWRVIQKNWGWLWSAIGAALDEETTFSFIQETSSSSTPPAYEALPPATLPVR